MNGSSNSGESNRRAKPLRRFFRCFVATWIVSTPIGALSSAAGYPVPDQIGIPVTLATVAALYLWSSRRAGTPGDTSWRSATRTALPNLLAAPAGATDRATMSDAAPSAVPLAAMRAVYLAFAFAIVGVTGVVAALIPEAEGTAPATPVAAGVAGIGAVAVLLVGRVGAALEATSVETLLGAYRARFFLRLAFAQLPCLVGFAGFMATGQWYVYALAVPFSVIGFVIAAPTNRSIETDDARLANAGVPHRLRPWLLPETS